MRQAVLEIIGEEHDSSLAPQLWVLLLYVVCNYTLALPVMNVSQYAPGYLLGIWERAPNEMPNGRGSSCSIYNASSLDSLLLC